MIRRIVDSNLLDLDFDNVTEQQQQQPPSGAAAVPNFSLLSSATTGNITTLAGEPEVKKPPAGLVPQIQAAGASFATAGATSLGGYRHSLMGNGTGAAAGGVLSGQLPTLSDSDLDIDDDDDDDDSLSGLLTEEDLEGGGINPEKLQELAQLLSMFSPHLNELTQQQRALEASGCCPHHPSPPPPPPAPSSTSSAVGGLMSAPPPHVCPLHPHNHVTPPIPAVVPVRTPPPRQQQQPTTSKNRKKKKNQNGAGGGTNATSSMASAASSNNGRAAAATMPTTAGQQQQHHTNHVWISAASGYDDTGGSASSVRASEVFKEMEERILPFLKNTYVSEYRFPHKLSAVEKKTLKRIASDRDLDCITVDEGKERYVALKKRPPKELSPSEVEMTIDQLEKQARKTLSLVKMLTEKRAAAPGQPALPVAPLSPQQLAALGGAGATCSHGVLLSSIGGHASCHAPPAATLATGAVAKAAATPAATTSVATAGGGSQAATSKPAATAATAKTVTKGVAMTTSKDGGNEAGHEISIQANAHELPGKKRMIDVGLQTCPEGWYVCQYCEQDTPETEQVSHRASCLAEHRERMVARAAEADRRRARRRRRQRGEPDTDAGPEAESEARARLARIHDNDLDSLLKTVQQMDTKCNTRGCSVKAQLCQHCRHPFCIEHMRHHGCHNTGFTAAATVAMGASGATAAPAVGVGVSTGTDMEGGEVQAMGGQHRSSAGPPAAHSELSYFERSQLRRNFKQKMAALKERRT